MIELKVVPDPLVFPPYQRTFGAAAVWGTSVNRYPVRRLVDIQQLVGIGIITVDEARAREGL